MSKFDSIGTVLFELEIGPLWGPRGHVAKALKLNPKLLRNPNRLPDAGTWIKLPYQKGWHRKIPKKYLGRIRFDEEPKPSTPKIQAEKVVAPVRKEKKKKAVLEKEQPKQLEVVKISLPQISKEIVENEVHRKTRYRIRRGDTLSEILLRYGRKPLWGDTGSVNTTVLLNSDKVRSAHQLPEVGEWIWIPEWSIEKLKFRGAPPKVTPQPLLVVHDEIPPKPSKKPLKRPPTRKVAGEANSEFWYQVKRGDTLGAILYAHEISPLWGKKGNVLKAVKMNGWRSASDLPEVGTWIRLPKPPEKHLKQANAENEKFKTKPEEHYQALLDDQEQAAVPEAVLVPVPEPVAEASVPEPEKLEKKEPEKTETEKTVEVVEPAPIPVAEKPKPKPKPKPKRVPGEFWYQVKRGDSLGTILFAHEISPLWGKKGNVLKSVKMNGWKSASDLPEVGNWIRLPEPPEKHRKEIEKSNEVFLSKSEEHYQKLVDEKLSREALEKIAPEAELAQENIEVPAVKSEVAPVTQVQEEVPTPSETISLPENPDSHLEIAFPPMKLVDGDDEAKQPGSPKEVFAGHTGDPDHHLDIGFSPVRISGGDLSISGETEESVVQSTHESVPDFHQNIAFDPTQLPDFADNKAKEKEKVESEEDESISLDGLFTLVPDLVSPAPLLDGESFEKAEEEEATLASGVLPNLPDFHENMAFDPTQLPDVADLIPEKVEDVENLESDEDESISLDGLFTLVPDLVSPAPLLDGEQFVSTKGVAEETVEDEEVSLDGLFTLVPDPISPAPLLDGEKFEETEDSEIESIAWGELPNVPDLHEEPEFAPIGFKSFYPDYVPPKREPAKAGETIERPVEEFVEVDTDDFGLPSSLPSKEHFAEEVFQPEEIDDIPREEGLKLTPEMMDQLRDQVIESVKEEVKDEIRDEIRAEIREEIMAEIREEFERIKGSGIRLPAGSSGIESLKQMDKDCEDPANSSDELCQFLQEKVVDRAPQAVTIMKSEDFLRDWGTFIVKPGIYTTRMTSRDIAENADATLSAALHANLNLGWQLELVDKWSVMTKANLGLLDYKAPTNFDLNSSGQMVMNLGAGIRYAWTDKLFTDVIGGLHGVQVLSSISETALTVVTANLPYGQVAVRYEGIYYGPLALSVEAGAKLYMGGAADGLTITGGMGGYLTIDQRIAINKSNILGGAFLLDLGSIDTSNSTNSLSTMGGQIFWIWKP